MKATFDVLPTEIFFEIFDYLTVYEIFHAWINLNARLDGIIRSYPVQLDFQRISRAKFDFLCQNIRPMQVLSVTLSDEMMPNQVELFRRNFPHFHQKFTGLRKIQFVNASTILPNLPMCLSSLSIKTYLKSTHMDHLITQVLHQQAKHLTYLHVDGSYALRSVKTSFPALTHLTIDYCTMTEFHRIVNHLQCPLIYLRLYIDKDENTTVFNFEPVVPSLTHLSLSFSEEMFMSFELIKQSIRQLARLTRLTIQATGAFDLMNGELWEEYLSGSQIERFYFKFLLANSLTCEQDKHSLLQSFRSPFWLDVKHWYVACEKGNLKSSRPIIYSVPYFQPSLIFYPSDRFLSVSTSEKQAALSNRTINLILTFHTTVALPTIPFKYVYALTLFTATLPPIEFLQAIVDLKRIQELDVSLIKHVAVDDLQSLIHYASNLKCIKMQYNPLFIPPFHIDSYIFVQKDREIFVLDANKISRFCHLFFHIRYLEITVESKEIIIQLLNELHYLEFVKIYCYQDRLITTKCNWLTQNVPRLKTTHFTYRITSSCILLSIGDSKMREFELNGIFFCPTKTSTPAIADDDSTADSADDAPVKPGCYKFRSRCVIQ